MLGMEKRHAEIVRADPLPDAALKIILPTRHDGAFIERAEVDGNDAWLYVRCLSKAGCGQGYGGLKYSWLERAPDGTVIGSAWSFFGIGNAAPPSLSYGDRTEVHFGIQSDPRAVSIAFSVDW